MNNRIEEIRARNAHRHAFYHTLDAALKQATNDTEYLLEQLAERDAEIERLREAQRWIPVGERLPTEDERRENDTRELKPLLVCMKGTKYPFRAFCDGKFWGDGWDKIDVTHWMELPAAPEEGE